MSAAPRGLSRPHASFIGTVCQGIHHCALHNNPTTSPNRDPWAAIANTQRKTQNCVQLEHSTIRSSHTSTTPHNRAWPTRNKRTNTHTPQQGCVQAAPATTDRCASVHSQYEHQPHPNGCGRCSRPLSSSQTTTTPQARTTRRTRRTGPMGAEHPPHTRGVAVRGPNSMHRTTTDPQGRQQILDLFHTSRDDPHPHKGGKHIVPKRTPHGRPTELRRKEVIQPHLPVRLPCYDLVPITSLTLDGSPQQNWSGHRLRVLPTFMT